MNNKYNVQIIVPALYKKYDIFIPANKTIGETIFLLEKALKILTKDSFTLKKGLSLYNANDGQVYDLNLYITETNIKNGSILVLC